MRPNKGYVRVADASSNVCSVTLCRASATVEVVQEKEEEENFIHFKVLERWECHSFSSDNIFDLVKRQQQQI